MVELEVLKTSGKSLGKITASDSFTVSEIKQQIAGKWNIPVVRQAIRAGPKAKTEDDAAKLRNIQLETPGKIYVKDLGPQIGWNTVFYFEYAGPIFLYWLILLLPNCIYGRNVDLQRDHGDYKLFLAEYFPFKFLNNLCNSNATYKISQTAFFAGIFWTIHYGKRILETALVHRFSHGTMPIFNLFKNCSYYWGFALYIAYHINHPLHTPPPTFLFVLGSIIFLIFPIHLQYKQHIENKPFSIKFECDIGNFRMKNTTAFHFCELGNLSIHLLLRNLRPEGTNVRKIPLPNSNPFTLLFNYVSCPNYTYEFGSWVGFTLLTGCLPVFIFALAGLYQMSVWAIGKHKKYLKEFKDYPRRRKAILPFLI